MQHAGSNRSLVLRKREIGSARKFEPYHTATPPITAQSSDQRACDKLDIESKPNCVQGRRVLLWPYRNTESHIMDCSSWLGSTIALGNHLSNSALLSYGFISVNFDCNDWLLVSLRRVGRLIIPRSRRTAKTMGDALPV